MLQQGSEIFKVTFTKMTFSLQVKRFHVLLGAKVELWSIIKPVEHTLCNTSNNSVRFKLPYMVTANTIEFYKAICYINLFNFDRT